MNSPKAIDRRDFIKRAAFAAGGLASTAMIERDVCAVEKQKDSPLFTFVQLNDTHINIPDNQTYKYEKANQKFKYLVKTINKEQNFPLPDFVILTGDIIHGTKIKNLLPECEMARDLLSTLRCPYYTLVGNHENIQREGVPKFQGAYEKVFGKDRVNYHFQHKGILFVCLNNSNGCGIGDSDERMSYLGPSRLKIAEKRNKWLKDVLGKYPDTPKIIACHIPLACIRDETVLKESFGFPTYKMVGNGTWDIVRAENKTVIAVIHGHLHLTGMVQKDGIHHISPSGSASYPCHYAHYTVYRDRIKVRMIPLAKDLVTPSTNIHGKPRYDHGFTDSSHKDAELYVSGNKQEKLFSISLAGKVNLLK